MVAGEVCKEEQHPPCWSDMHRIPVREALTPAVSAVRANARRNRRRGVMKAARLLVTRRIPRIATGIQHRREPMAGRGWGTGAKRGCPGHMALRQCAMDPCTGISIQKRIISHEDAARLLLGLSSSLGISQCCSILSHEVRNPDRTNHPSQTNLVFTSD